jgi:hypothetical protein
VSTFTDDAGAAVRSLFEQDPRKERGGSGRPVSLLREGAFNPYGEENVESDAVRVVLPECRIHGMFARGELGPTTS